MIAHAVRSYFDNGYYMTFCGKLFKIKGSEVNIVADKCRACQRLSEPTWTVGEQ